MSFNTRFWSLLALVFAATLLRLAIHIPNFSPIAAMALFGGAMFSRGNHGATRAIAILVPLAALFLSDLVIGFHDQMPAVYGSIALIALLGSIALDGKLSWLRVGGSAIGSSAIFFAVTNFSVWASSGMYAHNSAGLIECYIAALPFLSNTLAGDMCFSFAIFAVWGWAEKSIPELRLATIGDR